MHGLSASAQPRAEISSNFNEMRSNLEDMIYMLRDSIRRLVEKNESLFGPTSLKLDPSSKENGRVSDHLPLISEMNDTLTSMRVELSRLSDAISITETI